MTAAPESCTMRLTALSGTPLDEPVVRSTVVSTAHALAERTGIRLLRLDTTTSAITVTLGTDRLAGLGFLAELRRLTNRWYEDKYRDGPLWGTPKQEPEIE